MNRWQYNGEWEVCPSVNFQVGDEIRLCNSSYGPSDSGCDFYIAAIEGRRMFTGDKFTGKAGKFGYLAPEQWGDAGADPLSIWYRRVKVKPYDPTQQADEEDDI